MFHYMLPLYVLINARKEPHGNRTAYTVNASKLAPTNGKAKK